MVLELKDIWLSFLLVVGTVSAMQSLRLFFRILARMDSKTAKDFDNYYLPLLVTFFLKVKQPEA